MAEEYVGIDLHRRRSVIYRMDQAGETSSTRSGSRTNQCTSPGRSAPLRSALT
jgi:hypothetical protein